MTKKYVLDILFENINSIPTTSASLREYLLKKLWFDYPWASIY